MNWITFGFGLAVGIIAGVTFIVYETRRALVKHFGTFFRTAISSASS